MLCTISPLQHQVMRVAVECGATVDGEVEVCDVIGFVFLLQRHLVSDLLLARQVMMVQPSISSPHTSVETLMTLLTYVCVVPDEGGVSKLVFGDENSELNYRFDSSLSARLQLFTFLKFFHRSCVFSLSFVLFYCVGSIARHVASGLFTLYPFEVCNERVMCIASMYSPGLRPLSKKVILSLDLRKAIMVAALKNRR